MLKPEKRNSTRKVDLRPRLVTAGASLGRALALTVALLPLAFAHAWQVTGLFNSGVDNNGNPLPPGSPDPHYTLTYNNQTGPAYVRGNYSAWVPAPTGSAWIGPAASQSGDPSGYFTYSIQWWLDPQGDDPAQLTLSGYWASDNHSWIQLNSQPTGYSLGAYGFQALQFFQITGLQAGWNTLDFLVYNAPTSWGTPTPTGLLVSDLRITGPTGIPLPEAGSTFSILAAALVLISGLRPQAPPRAACT